MTVVEPHETGLPTTADQALKLFSDDQTAPVTVDASAFKFFSIAHSSNCPKGFMQFKTGSFILLGECQSEAGMWTPEDTEARHSFAFECNVDGDELLMRTYDEPGCSGRNVVAPYEMQKVRAVHCVKKAIHVDDPFTSVHAECQWAKLSVWDVSQLKADECTTHKKDTELSTTLPIEMCMPANNKLVRDLMEGTALGRMLGMTLFWKVRTEDCEEFVASMFHNDDCSGEAVFTKAIITGTSPMPNLSAGSDSNSKGMCFETVQCNVDALKALKSKNEESERPLWDGHGEAVIVAVSAVALMVVFLLWITKRSWQKVEKMSGNRNDLQDVEDPAAQPLTEIPENAELSELECANTVQLSK